MENVGIQILLPRDQADYLADRASAEVVSVGQILRDAVLGEMRRRAAPKTPNRAEEALVARLQRLLVPAMSLATDWDDLDRRLLALGHTLRPAGGGLTVHDVAGARLCKSSEIGFAYARFVRKFRCPMPGHPHAMTHILTSGGSGRAEVSDDFDVIERQPFFRHL